MWLFFFIPFITLLQQIVNPIIFEPQNKVLLFLNAGVAQLVEHHVANVNVAGPSPVSRSGNSFPSNNPHLVDFLF